MIFPNDPRGKLPTGNIGKQVFWFRILQLEISKKYSLLFTKIGKQIN